MNYNDLLPEPRSLFGRGINRICVMLLEGVEPLAKLTTPDTKPRVHLVLGVVSWTLLVGVLWVTGFASAFVGLWLLIGAVDIWYNVTKAQEAEARADGTGIDLTLIGDLPRSIKVELITPFVVVFGGPFHNGPTTASIGVLVVLLFWGNLALLCFTGGTGMKDKIRHLIARIIPTPSPAGSLS